MHKILYLLITIILYSCAQQESKPIVYPFKGIIIDIFYEDQKMMIKHDEVPGFMMEMTMMFNIDPSIDMNDYAIGDSLNFNFYILEKENSPAKTWANQMQIVGHRNLKEEEIIDDFFDEDGVLQIGDKLSSATFLNLNGEEVELSYENGKFKFISFIFSRCPMPNFCPAVILKNQYLVNQFKENSNIEFIVISFDYRYDTPNVLKRAYGNIFENYSNIDFLSSYGYKENIIKITTEAGLGFSGIDEGDARTINHTLKSLLVDPEGLLISSYSGDDWVPKEVEKNIINRLKAYGLD
tara:strand:+ start:99 stop:983 length:885 start_codon:yes stop_codon:yes gene_type:complete